MKTRIELVEFIEDSSIVDGRAIAAKAAKALTRVIDTVMTSLNG
jgi:hypothetical protein